MPACPLISPSEALGWTSYAANVANGYLRLPLIWKTANSLGSSMYDFDPFSDHRSIYTGRGSGDSPNPQFWMANVEADGQGLIDRW